MNYYSYVQANVTAKIKINIFQQARNNFAGTMSDLNRLAIEK